jgi:hypothetical protein
MIDQWFKQDLQEIFATYGIAVFIDESGEAEFLLSTLGNDYIIYPAHSEIEELHVKYLIEKAQPTAQKFLIYTRTQREKLKFIREYCETNGCLEIRYLQNYIKQNVHQTLNLNINLPTEDLISAAKVSVGKDRTYWFDLSHKGASEIFDLKRELLPFIHDPDRYAQEKYDAQLRQTFYRKVSELLGQDYLEKPPSTLATEVVQTLFNGLAQRDCPPLLTDIYHTWLDSRSYRSSLESYLQGYNLPPGLDLWQVSPDHPFKAVDEQWLQALSLHLHDKAKINQILPHLKQRHRSPQAQALNITFWGDVITLLEFDPKNINYLSSLAECVEFYTRHFYQLDTAIRHLYTEFLNRPDLLEPWQALYRDYLAIFLDRWFTYWPSYQENQTGILQKLIDQNPDTKIAVIVGDGVAYEMAEQVATKVKGQAQLTRNVILADIPSETENNMSRIYLDNGLITGIHGDRERYLLAQNANLSIDLTLLEAVNDEPLSGQVLICTYKDIDDMGEKLQQKALKYFGDTIDFFAQKISQLLHNGYSKVYLITDHGFVLTGLLTEADKITIALSQGEAKTAERYIRTVQLQPAWLPHLIEVKKAYHQFQYLYFAQSINPFKTPGLYGFAHGGLAPQELITPFFCWEQSAAITSTLPVAIANKDDLTSVTGELFTIKLRAEPGQGDLFSGDRRVYLVFFANKQPVNKSDVFSIPQDTLMTKEYTFDGHGEIEVQLLDANTKQLLDKALVKQNKERDLGGLF